MRTDGSDAVAKTSKGKTIFSLIQEKRGSIEQSLPRNIDLDRFTRICMVNLSMNKKLLECEPVTLLTAVMQSAQLGLEPGGPLGLAHLVPYKNRVSFIIGYRGLVELLFRTGRFVKVLAREVRQGDTFQYEYGTNERLIHSPAPVDKRGDITHFYAYVKDGHGEITFDVMERAEVERIRDTYSKAWEYKKESSVWGTDFGEMGKKTVLRRLCKLLQLSPEEYRPLSADESVKREIRPDMTEVPNEEGLDVSLEDAGISGDVMKELDEKWDNDAKSAEPAAAEEGGQKEIF